MATNSDDFIYMTDLVLEWCCAKNFLGAVCIFGLAAELLSIQLVTYGLCLVTPRNK